MTRTRTIRVSKPMIQRQTRLK